MSDSPTLGLLAAAKHLGISINALRRATRAGDLPAPPALTATAPVSAEWLTGAQAAMEASPTAFHSRQRQRVPPFARYEGTSAWRKYRNRVREYNHNQASAS